jgi:hypothetical protein
MSGGKCSAEAKRRKNARYRAKNLEKCRQWDREKTARWRARNPDYTWVRELKLNYGLTREAYEAMLASQRGVCAICGKTDRLGRRLAVDHAHDTGAIRALLCGDCNVAIGLLQEDPRVIESAAAYVRRHGR